MFFIEDRNNIEFDEFEENGKCAELFKKNLLSFDDDVKDSFFNAVPYGLIFKLTESNRVLKENIEGTLGKQFFEDMNESKELLRLDDSLDDFLRSVVALTNF